MTSRMDFSREEHNQEVDAEAQCTSVAAVPYVERVQEKNEALAQCLG